MRLSREAYEAALDELRRVAGGEVSETDYMTPTLGPYRLAIVQLRVDLDDAARIAHNLAMLAVEVRGCLWMFVGPDWATVEVSITRDLSPEEADGLVAYRPVNEEGEQ